MARLYVGVLAVYGLFQAIAIGTDSAFGEWGIVIAIVIVAATAAAAVLLPLERGVPKREQLRGLGLGKPSPRALAVTIGIGALMLGFYPIFAALTDASISLRRGWYLLLPGLFAQAGIAEEVLFRGYLFGQLRRRRTFWRAAWLSLPAFAIAHVALFFMMEPVLAAVATLLSIAVSLPLARLFDLGGSTIWAPALLHFVIQAAPKIVVAAPAVEMPLAVGWMAVAMVVPWIAFAIRR